MAHIYLICYEFKLQHAKGLNDLISKSEYGRHVIHFFKRNFQVDFQTSFHKHESGVWTEVLVTSDTRIVLTLRLYDRRNVQCNYNYLMTLNMDFIG